MTYYRPIDGETRKRLKRERDRAVRKRLAARTPSPASAARADDFLLTALEDGPRARAELVAEAVALGIGEWALAKAKQHLGVEHRHDGPKLAPGQRGTTWRLPAYREGE